MRNAFEAWAQRDGHIVRRREDKPEEYLVFETQRRWVIWQAALAHGKTAAATPKLPREACRQRQPSRRDKRRRCMAPDEAAMRNRVLNEVLDAFSDLDEAAGIEGVLQGDPGPEEKAEGAGRRKSRG